LNALGCLPIQLIAIPMPIWCRKNWMEKIGQLLRMRRKMSKPERPKIEPEKWKTIRESGKRCGGRSGPPFEKSPIGEPSAVAPTKRVSCTGVTREQASDKLDAVPVIAYYSGTGVRAARTAVSRAAAENIPASSGTPRPAANSRPIKTGATAVTTITAACTVGQKSSYPGRTLV
jgi:hypothetical protein